MKKLIIFSLAIWAGGVANAHPLDRALRNLSQVSEDLRDVQPITDTEHQALLSLRKKAVSLWRDALLLPLESSDRELEMYGFQFGPSLKPGNAIYVLHILEVSSALKNEALAMDGTRWSKVAAIADLQTKLLADIGAIVSVPEFTKGIPDKDLAEISRTTDREEGLEYLRSSANRTLECIAMFGPKSSAAGLIVVGSEGGYGWSPEALLKFYGTQSLDALTPEQKKQVIQDLLALLNRMTAYRRTCLADSKIHFVATELRRLRGD